VFATLLRRVLDARNIVRPLNDVRSGSGTFEHFRTRLTFLFHSTSRTFWQSPGLWAERDRVEKKICEGKIKLISKTFH
jgi:hypothetical protein